MLTGKTSRTRRPAEEARGASRRDSGVAGPGLAAATV
jgi:hypothetical protein